MSAPPAAPALVALLGLGLLALIALAGADAVLDEGEHADDGHDAVGTDNDLPEFFPDAVGCVRSEPRKVVNHCIKTNLQNMIPHMNEGGKVGLPSLDPYFVPEIKVDFKSYIADFHAIVSKMDVSGLTKMTLLDARGDLKNDSMNLEVDVFLPVLNYRGQFEFTNGFFSDTWQFKGHGPFEVVFHNISASWYIQGKKEPGSKYMTVTKGSPKYAVGGMKIWGKNFVEGYPFLDDIIISVANRLWRDVVRFGRPAVQDEFSEQLRKLSNLVFQHIPYDTIFPPA